MRSIKELIPEKEHRDYIDSRIQDIEKASMRSRWLYGLIIMVSWILLAMAYNTTWSYIRGFAEKNEEEPMRSAKSLADNTVAVGRDVLVRNQLKNWVDSLQFEVPVLGARFSATDAGIVGGLLLCILGTWCLYSAKRENHLIYYLVRDCEKYNASTAFRKYLKNQLHATQLFTRSKTPRALGSRDLLAYTDRDAAGLSEIRIKGEAWLLKPDSSFALRKGTRICAEALPELATEGSVNQWKVLGSDELLEILPGQFEADGMDRKFNSSWRIRGVARWRYYPLPGWLSLLVESFMTLIVFFLPAVSLLIVLLADVATLYMNTPFRSGGLLIEIICSEGCTNLVQRLSISAVFALICAAIMIAAFRYQRATSSILRYLDQYTWSRKALPDPAEDPLIPFRAKSE